MAASVTPYNDHIIIFDFDCTLTTKHFFSFFKNNNYGLLNKKNLDKIADIEIFKQNILDNKINEEEKQIIIEEFFGESDRFAELKQTLKKLKEIGCKIIILSNGITVHIIALLKCVELFNLFDEIIGLYEEGYKKNRILNDIISNKECKYLYYFDDDRKENDALITFFMKNHIYEKLTPKPYIEMSYLSIKLGEELFKVQYNFFNALELNRNGLTETQLKFLLKTIENSIHEFNTSSTLPSMPSEQVLPDPKLPAFSTLPKELKVLPSMTPVQTLPVDGTIKFEESVTNAEKYFEKNAFIFTAVKSKSRDKWFINSSENPSKFRTFIDFEPHEFAPLPPEWVVTPNISAKSKCLKYRKKYLKYKKKYLNLSNIVGGTTI